MWIGDWQKLLHPTPPLVSARCLTYCQVQFCEETGAPLPQELRVMGNCAVLFIDKLECRQQKLQHIIVTCLCSGEESYALLPNMQAVSDACAPEQQDDNNSNKFKNYTLREY